MTRFHNVAALPINLAVPCNLSPVPLPSPLPFWAKILSSKGLDRGFCRFSHF